MTDLNLFRYVWDFRPSNVRQKNWSSVRVENPVSETKVSLEPPQRSTSKHEPKWSCYQSIYLTILILKHQRRRRFKNLSELQKLSAVSRSKSTSGESFPGVLGGPEGVGLRVDGQREALFTFLPFFFCFSFNFWRESFLRLIFNLIFSFGVGGTSELLELELKELEVDASLVL